MRKLLLALAVVAMLVLPAAPAQANHKECIKWGGKVYCLVLPHSLGKPKITDGPIWPN